MHTHKPKRNWIVIGLLLALVIAGALGSCVLKTATPSAPPSATAPGGAAPGAGGEEESTEGTGTPIPVEAATPTTTPTPHVVAIGVVKVELIDVYTGPAKTYPILARITYGDVLRILGRNAQKTWLYILIPDDRKGWIEVEAVEGTFDIDSLPVIQPTPTPGPDKTPQKTDDTTYGLGVLVPPDLDGVSPASAHNPVRSGLALATVLALAGLAGGVYALLSRRRKLPFAPALARLLQLLASLL